MVVFLLNGLAFALIGLQLEGILEALSESDYAPATLVLYAAAVSLAVIVVRVAWVFPATYLPRWVSPRLRERDPSPPWRSVAVISWAGMRGVISLAAALALPRDVPGHNLILFLTFCIILATLVVQGLSLPALIRFLGLEDDGSTEREEVRGRIEVARAALDRIEEVAEEDWMREDTAERMRGMYNYRKSRFIARSDGEDTDGLEGRSTAYQRLMRELLTAQRKELVRLRDEGEIGDEAMHRIERELDLEESRLET